MSYVINGITYNSLSGSGDGGPLPVTDQTNNMSQNSNTSSPQSNTSSPQSNTSSPQSNTSSPQSNTSSPQSNTSSPQSNTSSPQSNTSSPQSGYNVDKNDDRIQPRIARKKNSVQMDDSSKLQAAGGRTVSESEDYDYDDDDENYSPPPLYYGDRVEDRSYIKLPCINNTWEQYTPRGFEKEFYNNMLAKCKEYFDINETGEVTCTEKVKNMFSSITLNGTIIPIILNKYSVFLFFSDNYHDFMDSYGFTSSVQINVNFLLALYASLFPQDAIEYILYITTEILTLFKGISSHGFMGKLHEHCYKINKIFKSSFFYPSKTTTNPDDYLEEMDSIHSSDSFASQNVDVSLIRNLNAYKSSKQCIIDNDYENYQLVSKTSKIIYKKPVLVCEDNSKSGQAPGLILSNIQSIGENVNAVNTISTYYDEAASRLKQADIHTQIFPLDKELLPKHIQYLVFYDDNPHTTDFNLRPLFNTDLTKKNINIEVHLSNLIYICTKSVEKYGIDRICLLIYKIIFYDNNYHSNTSFCDIDNLQYLSSVLNKFLIETIDIDTILKLPSSNNINIFSPVFFNDFSIHFGILVKKIISIFTTQVSAKNISSFRWNQFAFFLEDSTDSLKCSTDLTFFLNKILPYQIFRFCENQGLDISNIFLPEMIENYTKIKANIKSAITGGNPFDTFYLFKLFDLSYPLKLDGKSATNVHYLFFGLGIDSNGNQIDTSINNHTSSLYVSSKITNQMFSKIFSNIRNSTDNYNNLFPFLSILISINTLSKSMKRATEVLTKYFNNITIEVSNNILGVTQEKSKLINLDEFIKMQKLTNDVIKDLPTIVLTEEFKKILSFKCLLSKYLLWKDTDNERSRISSLFQIFSDEAQHDIDNSNDVTCTMFDIAELLSVSTNKPTVVNMMSNVCSLLKEQLDVYIDKTRGVKRAKSNNNFDKDKHIKGLDSFLLSTRLASRNEGFTKEVVDTITSICSTLYCKGDLPFNDYQEIMEKIEKYKGSLKKQLYYFLLKLWSDFSQAIESKCIALSPKYFQYDHSNTPNTSNYICRSVVFTTFDIMCSLISAFFSCNTFFFGLGGGSAESGYVCYSLLDKILFTQLCSHNKPNNNVELKKFYKCKVEYNRDDHLFLLLNKLVLVNGENDITNINRFYTDNDNNEDDEDIVLTTPLRNKIRENVITYNNVTKKYNNVTKKYNNVTKKKSQKLSSNEQSQKLSSNTHLQKLYSDKQNAEFTKEIEDLHENTGAASVIPSNKRKRGGHNNSDNNIKGGYKNNKTKRKLRNKSKLFRKTRKHVK
jgi:hypothetical protein